MEIKDYQNKLQQLKGRKIQLEKSITDLTIEIRNNKRSLNQHEQAREVLREVGLKTQQTLQVHISDIATLAFEAIFDDPYELSVEFVQRRNKTECDLLFSRDGNKVDPLEASGGGAVDVAAFALRIASWTMQRPRSSNVMILDEPMRFLSVDLQERASQMIKELSDKLGIQFIIISHEHTLAAAADKVFEVSKRKGVSKIVEQ
jgi:DNA repair exonuclease SbcCD ATPase subunit